MKYLSIEKSSLESLEKIVRFNYKIFDGMYKDKPYSLEQYKNKLKNKDTIIFVSKLDGKITGNSISFKRDNSFYIWIFGVNKEYRRKGIGSFLLDKNEQFARENGYKSVSTKVYNVSGEMQRLLENRGYKVVEIEESKTDPNNMAIHFELQVNDTRDTNS